MYSGHYQPCHVKLTIFSAGQVYNPFRSSQKSASLQVCSLQVCKSASLQSASVAHRSENQLYLTEISQFSLYVLCFFLDIHGCLYE